MIKISIQTERFLLRTITEEDVSPAYLSWLQDGVSNKFINSASQDIAMDDLRQFIVDRSNRDDIIFLAIIDSIDDLHIGNIKYEPVNAKEGYAIMGILIGDESYRGKNVAGEVIKASANWLWENLELKAILLGVHKLNYPAIKAYEKIGFVVSETPYITNISDDSCTMMLKLSEEAGNKMPIFI